MICFGSASEQRDGLLAKIERQATHLFFLVLAWPSPKHMEIVFGAYPVSRFGPSKFTIKNDVAPRNAGGAADKHRH